MRLALEAASQPDLPVLVPRAEEGAENALGGAGGGFLQK